MGLGLGDEACVEAVYDLMMVTPEGTQERGANTWAYDLLAKVKSWGLGLGWGPDWARRWGWHWNQGWGYG